MNLIPNPVRDILHVLGIFMGLQNQTIIVLGVESYGTAFLFFIETETTIGFGRRSITENCPEGTEK